MRADPLPELWGKDDEDASALEEVFHLDLPLVRTNAVAGPDLQRCIGPEAFASEKSGPRFLVDGWSKPAVKARMAGGQRFH
jgi:hypothetical protein